MALVNQGGSLLLQNGALASGAGCCCSTCTCECYEVGVKGRWDSNQNPYADPNNEFWSTATANNCGYAQAAYGKLDYPVTIGGYTVTLNGGGVTVTQYGSTGCADMGYDWPDAALTYGEDGCPNGIDLGEPVFTCSITSGSFNCDPMFGDWGGTDEEICQKARDFLDANPPEINLRACPENPLP